MSKLTSARAAIRQGGFSELIQLVRRKAANKIQPRSHQTPVLPAVTRKQSAARDTKKRVMRNPPTILDEFVMTAPSNQNAVNLFAGEWASALPEVGVMAGSAQLFEDPRIAWALDQIGDVTGRSILECGPLEGGHSFMMSRAGAHVLAIEAQSRAYLKCLIAKELLGMDRVRFELGDFMEYLRTTESTFDVCVASGVLYHMRNPVETIALTARVAQVLVLWTHYYDAETLAKGPDFPGRFPSQELFNYEGFEHTLYRHEYGAALSAQGFCGGSAPHSAWMSREEILNALENFGWKVVAIAFETKDHPNGPALALVAEKR